MPVQRHILRRSVAVAALMTLIAVLIPAMAPTAVSASTPTLTFNGRGWGHGRGMSQWGAQGYATNHGWNYRQILGHYYGGTTVGSAGNPTVRVRLDDLNDDTDVHLTAAAGASVTYQSAAGTFAVPAGHRHVRLRFTGGQWTVWTRPSTSHTWTGVAQAGSAVTVRSSNARLTVDETGRTYPGAIQARFLSPYYRTMAIVPTEEYLRGVVPNESPASWSIEALKAQAVAARSYMLAGDGRWTIGGVKYADTCDTTLCQVYNPSETASRTDAAIAQTAGEVRKHSSGAIARTEFSSSSGGWTAGGTFPAVEDKGDSISPHHTWTASLSAAPLQNKYGGGSELTSIAVVRRNGLGAMGGRALDVRLGFANGTTVTVTGDAVRSTMGLRSNWFDVAIPTRDPQPPAGLKVRFNTVNGTNYRPLIGDFDGNGRSDVFWYAPGPTPDYVWFSDGNGGFTSTAVSVGGNYQALVGDVDNNGVDDIVWYNGPSSSVWRWNSSRRFTSTSMSIPSNRTVFLADIGGDGRHNVVVYGPGALSDAILTWGSGRFTSRAITVNGSYRPFVGDFDGNGAEDIFWYAPGPGADAIWWTASGGAIASTATSVSGNYKPLIGDFDGNGSDDVMWYGVGSLADYTWFGNSNRAFASRSTPVGGSYTPTVADLGGDGRDDIVWYAPGTAPDHWWRYGSNRSLTSSRLTINGSYVPGAGTFGSGRDGIFWYGPGSGADALWYA